MSPRLSFPALVAGALLLAGCTQSVRISRLVNDPYRYQNRNVRVSGTVTRSVNAVVAGGYQVDDGTGTIVVLSNQQPPRQGTRVTVDGRVQSGVAVLGRNFGTTLRERDRRIRN